MFTIDTGGGLLPPKGISRWICREGLFPGSDVRQARRADQQFCLVWVDDVVVWRQMVRDFGHLLEAVLKRVMDRGLYEAAKKAGLLFKGIRSCGNL